MRKFNIEDHIPPPLETETVCSRPGCENLADRNFGDEDLCYQHIMEDAFEIMNDNYE